MTEQGERAAAPWRETGFATAWAARDHQKNLLALPRAFAAEIVAETQPEPELVVDLASGPGDFLAVFLDRFPSARGAWTDASQAMLQLARKRLAGHAGRVSFELLDMTGIAAATALRGADVVTTSRAAHHLDGPALAAFYGDAAGLLAPGGWLVNLDHTGFGADWDGRFRRARKRLYANEHSPKTAEKLAPHRHDFPLQPPAAHLAALRTAGLVDVVQAWQAGHTCMFLGRRPE